MKRFRVRKGPPAHPSLSTMRLLCAEMASSALKEKFGMDIIIMKPAKAQAMIRDNTQQRKSGTYQEPARIDIRTVYFQDGTFKTSATLQGNGLPPREERIIARQQFLEIADYAALVKTKPHSAVGYHGDSNIHFENAYYPIIKSDVVEVWKGDIFAGAIGLDPQTRLLTVSYGGDIGPMEHFGPRTESVFLSSNAEATKQSLSRACLDDGLGPYDRSRTSNIDQANYDVARSQDPILSAAITSEIKSQCTVKR